MLAADHEVNAGNGQHDGKQNNGRRRCVRRISAAGAVKHIVHIAHDGVHARHIQIRTKQRHAVTVGLECADKAGDYQIKQRRGNHG